jgi:hypothetical protein
MSNHTKSVEYRLVMRRGTHAKGRINNQFLITRFSISELKTHIWALLGLVGKMYSKIQSCRRGSGRNPTDTEDTKIDRFYSKLN